MRYSDTEGAASCKTCNLGTIPFWYRLVSQGTKFPIRCDPCKAGQFGKDDGKCYSCNVIGPMAYSDEAGSVSCSKTCPLGTIPDPSDTPYQCKPFPAGSYGGNDGKCHNCRDDGPMKYSDTEGSVACKTCRLGSVPQEYFRTSCLNCSKGRYGIQAGRCEFCRGRMSYSDEEGSTFCKTCPVGTQTRDGTSCVPCSMFRGTNGTIEGCLTPYEIRLRTTRTPTISL